jgi:hypothetical protein
MNGAILSLPQYAFMAWYSVKSTGATLPLTFTFYFPKGRGSLGVPRNRGMNSNLGMSLNTAVQFSTF